MKIYFVARGWPSEREPQWGCFERDQALALKKLGHEIVVLSVDARFRRYYRKYGITREVHDGITHYNLYAGFWWGRALRTISVSMHAYIGRRLLCYLYNKVLKQEGKPDLLYSHYLWCSSMALAVKQKYGIPLVGMEHWSELGYGDIKPQWKKWASMVYQELDLLLTVSSALQQNIKKNIGVDSVVVNNMIGGEFCYQPQDRHDDTVRFVSTGNLLPVKGFDILIEAFYKAGLPMEKWTLAIVGGGNEHDRLEGLIRQYDLGENITLTGRKDRSGVIGMLRESDIYIMSSLSETFGVAAVEALACGLPAICTECGGSADFMNDKNGVTCPPGNVAKMAESINYMFQHYKEYDRKAIAAECIEKFSSEHIGKKLDRILEEIINAKK